MNQKITEQEIKDLKIGDLIYFWYPAGADIDLFEMEVIDIGLDKITVDFEGKEIKVINKNNLIKYSSRNSVEEYCIKEKIRLLGKQPRDFRPLNLR
jgi:hypothetical protein